ncbi:hypothetical protein VIGAN_UM021700 [Vigna angularis var. angularis]|uniref:Uncharacterized protein n=1 Tax=Vigna angularis var. angularis TaxID=157739 RepID=A0A0S3TDW9_PHAAN|nr:hypothetical protein VIGAN_UM021700 [Vigna angularis var. angularis]
MCHLLHLGAVGSFLHSNVSLSHIQPLSTLLAATSSIFISLNLQACCTVCNFLLLLCSPFSIPFSHGLLMLQLVWLSLAGRESSSSKAETLLSSWMLFFSNQP